MSDETSQLGGARRGAGRPPGSKNRVPSKRAELNARLLEIVTPRFDEFVQELMRIALEGKREGDRLKAIAELFDRALGKSPEILEVCDEDLPVIDELLARWRESKPE